MVVKHWVVGGLSDFCINRLIELCSTHHRSSLGVHYRSISGLLRLNAHGAVALVGNAWIPLRLLSPLYKRNGWPAQRTALLRGGETAPRHDPIGGLSSRRTLPRGIPLLDKAPAQVAKESLARGAGV